MRPETLVSPVLKKFELLGSPYFQHMLEPEPTQIFIHDQTYNIDTHRLEIHASAVYEPAFQEFQFSHVKYIIFLENEASDEKLKIQVLLNSQGIIDSFHVFSADDKHQEVSSDDLNQIAILSYQHAIPFIEALETKHQAYRCELEHLFTEEIQKLLQTLKASDMSFHPSNVTALIHCLYQLSFLYPEEYSSIYKAFHQLVNAYQFEEKTNYMMNAKLKKLKALLDEKIPKSIRGEETQLLLNEQYIVQMKKLMLCHESIHDSIFKIKAEVSILNSLYQKLEFCALNLLYQEKMMDFAKVQAIVKDYRYMQDCLEVMGRKTPLRLLDAIIEQDENIIFTDILIQLQPSVSDINRLAERLIEKQKYKCFIALNYYCPINFLQYSSQGKPLACDIFYLDPSSPIRIFVLNEHKQFTSLHFFETLKQDLLRLPWHLIKVDLCVVNNALKVLKDASSSSSAKIGKNTIFYSHASHQQLLERLDFYPFIKQDILQKIDLHAKIDEELAHSLKNMLINFYEQVMKLICPHHPEISLSLLAKFDAFINQVNEIIQLSLDLHHMKKHPQQHSRKSKLTHLMQSYHKKTSEIESSCRRIELKYEKAMAETDADLLDNIKRLEDELTQFFHEKDEHQLLAVKTRLQMMKEKFPAPSPKDNQFIESHHLLPFKELLQSIDNEIRDIEEQAQFMASGLNL